MRRPLIQPLCLIIALVLVGCATDEQRPTSADVRDARAAFATLVEYQKTDDARSLDLFSKTCPVTFIDGDTGRTVVWPPDQFRESLKQQIALKIGDKDAYENVQYSKEGTSVLVTAMVHYADSGRRGPFSALYARDSQGVYKIQQLRVTVFAGASPK